MTTVEKIHKEVDEAQDMLLQEAYRIIADNKSENNKADRLEALGFTSSKVVEDHTRKKNAAVVGKKQAELIEYYKRTYPFLKFLTTDELNRICKKYGLVYSGVGSYVKDVPEKNVKEIEEAQTIKSKDVNVGYTSCKYKIYNWRGSSTLDYAAPSDAKKWENPIIIEGECYHDYSVKDALKERYNFKKEISFDGCILTYHNLSGLFIAAPKSHFNLEGKTKKGLGFFTVTEKEIKDPIVFRYVKGGVQVLSKWGDEGDDEALVNEINN